MGDVERKPEAECWVKETPGWPLKHMLRGLGADSGRDHEEQAADQKGVNSL